MWNKSNGDVCARRISFVCALAPSSPYKLIKSEKMNRAETLHYLATRQHRIQSIRRWPQSIRHLVNGPHIRRVPSAPAHTHKTNYTQTKRTAFTAQFETGSIFVWFIFFFCCRRRFSNRESIRRESRLNLIFIVLLFIRLRFSHLNSSFSILDSFSMPSLKQFHSCNKTTLIQLLKRKINAKSKSNG